MFLSEMLMFETFLFISRKYQFRVSFLMILLFFTTSLISIIFQNCDQLMSRDVSKWNIWMCSVWEKNNSLYYYFHRLQLLLCCLPGCTVSMWFHWSQGWESILWSSTELGNSSCFYFYLSFSLLQVDPISLIIDLNYLFDVIIFIQR